MLEPRLRDSVMLIKGYPHGSWEHVDDTIRIGTKVPIKFQSNSREFLSYASLTAIEVVTQHITGAPKSHAKFSKNQSLEHKSVSWGN